MIVKYKTIEETVEIEYVVEKSKFIGYAKPVDSEEMAEAFIAEIRKRHRTANHNVPVYVLGEHFQIQKYSDDGEPQGTAGVPILQMLIKENITNLVLVITRYFGGIKLGTGGLVRAYTATAKLALEKAKICGMCEVDVFDLEVDYSYLGKIQSQQNKHTYKIRNEHFQEKVFMEILVLTDQLEKIKEGFLEMTNGTGQLWNFRKTIILMEEGENGTI